MTNEKYINLNRAVISVSGSDAYKFLQGIITNNIGQVTDKDAIYSYLLTPQGKYLFDFFISKKKDAFLIEIAIKNKDEFLKKLKMYKLRSEVNIEDISNSHDVYAVLDNKAIYYSDPRNNKMPNRVIQPKNFFPKEQLVDIEFYHRLRVENNIPEGEYDLEKDKSYPLQYHMIDLKGVDFKKGCYVGQEVTARMYNRVAIRKSTYKIFCPFELQNHFGQDITRHGAVVGQVLSATGKQGLALINSEVAETPVPELNILGYDIAIIR